MDRVARPLIEEVREDLLPLIEERRDGALRAILLNLHPADIAAVLTLHNDEEEQVYLFGLVDNQEMASGILAELPPPVRETIMAQMLHEDLADLVEEMESDDAADLVQELSEETANRVLDVMEPEEAAQVRPLLEYAEDTAGGIMATEALTIELGARVGDARNAVRAVEEGLETYFFLYVISPDRRFQGILSMRDLVIARSDMLVRDVMDADPVTVGPEMDQEEVANIFRRYDLVAVPVVDKDGFFLGRITVDDVVDVVWEEAGEDMARMAGTADEELDELSARRIAMLRLPWILISLLGGLLAGAVLRLFTGSLGLVALVLITFVPVITAMGGNAGSQSAIIMVRRLALHPVGALERGHIVLREARVGIFLGLMCGVIVGVAAYVWLGEWFYGLVVGVAMVVAILVAATMGTVVPLAFRKIKVDPAIATGPFVSMTNDVLGLFIYFGLATLLLDLGGFLTPDRLSP
jgi:magnesium transporter